MKEELLKQILEHITPIKENIEYLMLVIEEQQMQNTKEKLEAENEMKLRLRVDPDDGFLDIYYGKKKDKGDVHRLGYLDNTGFSHIISNSSYYDSYNKWFDEGQKISITPVTWRKGEYSLVRKYDSIILTRVDIENGEVFNFTSLTPMKGCEDTNLKVALATKTPVVF